MTPTPAAKGEGLPVAVGGRTVVATWRGPAPKTAGSTREEVGGGADAVAAAGIGEEAGGGAASSAASTPTAGNPEGQKRRLE